MAVVVTVSDFRAQFPEFATTLDGVITLALDEAILIHSIRKLATLYCAAHLLTVPGIGAGGQGGSMGQVVVHGQVSTKTVGPLSVTYSTQDRSGSSSTSGSSQAHYEFFARTEYGRHFLVLESRTARTGIGAMVAGMRR